MEYEGTTASLDYPLTNRPILNGVLKRSDKLFQYFPIGEGGVFFEQPLQDKTPLFFLKMENPPRALGQPKGAGGGRKARALTSW